MEDHSMRQEQTNTPDASEKKVYSKPVFENYGDVRDVTLANSPRPETESGRGPGWRRTL